MRPDFSSNSNSLTTGWPKLLIGWTAVFLIRLIPFRAPNVEPLLATLMPFSKRFGPITSFLFAFFSIVLYDAVTAGIGAWTWIPAVAYGALGFGAYYFFKNHSASVKNYLLYGIPGTILYDAVTGLIPGPLFFHQSFVVALYGQIPFTILHLLGTIAFSVFLSPVLYHWVVRNEALEFRFSSKQALES